jgi:hypothetical protein
MVNELLCWKPAIGELFKKIDKAEMHHWILSFGYEAGVEHLLLWPC